MGTGEQTTKRNLMFAIFALMMPVNDILDGPEQSRGNQGFVRASVAFPGPLEYADVNGIGEDPVKIASILCLPEAFANRLP